MKRWALLLLRERDLTKGALNVLGLVTVILFLASGMTRETIRASALTCLEVEIVESFVVEDFPQCLKIAMMIRFVVSNVR
mmetsp:Transcript_95649/g.267857  ORF Transcript_95649/g.267857 Transcript_95649/m.267857 type:complete len:80 (-) Transcript_95649:72-311(-)